MDRSLVDEVSLLTPCAHRSSPYRIFVGSGSTCQAICLYSAPLLTNLSRHSRVISLYPAETDVASAEALSPVLGHLIDISLAMVLLERPVIVSPYSVRFH